jgi:methylase of polypeptide subunit release factors
MHFQFKKINFYINNKVFIPTGTSSMLYDAALRYFSPNKTTLELGCGIGIIGIALSKKKSSKTKIYMSDLSKEACKLAKKNLLKYKINHDLRCGKLFDPWKNANLKFDLIINDVSGISSQVSKISPWFKNVPCNSGSDGTLLTNLILKKSKNFLSKNGKLIFPIISLSNKKKIITQLKKNFKTFKIISTQKWPFPQEMIKKKNFLINLKKKNLIDFEEKFGTLTFTTDICLAQK